MSDQTIGDHGDPVAPAAGEVDQLHVEDDARDPLLAEEVVGRLAGEALEAALGVLDVADGPDRGEPVEGAAQQPPEAGLGAPHVAAVGLDPAAEGEVVVAERLDEERQLVRRGGHVGVGEDDEIGLGGEHPGLHRGALAAVGHRQQREERRPGDRRGRRLRASPDQVGGPVGAAVVDHQDAHVVRQAGRAGRPVPALSPCRRR